MTMETPERHEKPFEGRLAGSILDLTPAIDERIAAVVGPEVNAYNVEQYTLEQMNHVRRLRQTLAAASDELLSFEAYGKTHIEVSFGHIDYGQLSMRLSVVGDRVHPFVFARVDEHEIDIGTLNMLQRSICVTLEQYAARQRIGETQY